MRLRSNSVPLDANRTLALLLSGFRSDLVPGAGNGSVCHRGMQTARLPQQDGLHRKERKSSSGLAMRVLCEEGAALGLGESRDFYF